MTDPLMLAVHAATKTWRQEAEARRKVSRLDPVADTLEYCAGELAERLRSATAASEWETVERRAAREGVTPQTVRAWIRTGQLHARPGAHGYQILASAERVRASA